MTASNYYLTDSVYYYYDTSGSVIGFSLNDTFYFYGKNIQGDIKYIYDANGSIITEYCYDAWGKTLSITGSLASAVGEKNPFRYRGYYYDRETGFYYLNSRYYDPQVGRFINADGVMGANGGFLSYNLFSYCSNNPVIFSDHSGFIQRYTIMSDACFPDDSDEFEEVFEEVTGKPFKPEYDGPFR